MYDQKIVLCEFTNLPLDPISLLTELDKAESDVMMYVVGGMEENEIMLYNVILAVRDALHLLFKYVPG
jgi:hypothetical protein